MRLLVSGATATIRALLDDARYTDLARAHLGHLLTPSNGNRIEVLLDTGLPIAIDNAAYAHFLAGRSFDWRGFQAFIAHIADRWHSDARLRRALLWVAVPDSVGDWRRTGRMWDTWRLICDLPMGALRWAFVAQDGQTVARLPMRGDPRFGRWVGCGALFVGGSTAWKFGAQSRALVAAARAAGRWVHVGRVNSFARLDACDAVRADSFDGGQFSMYPKTYIPRYLERLRYRQLGMLQEAA